MQLLFPVCQETGDPVTDGQEYSELGEFEGEDFWDDSVGTLKSTRVSLHMSLAYVRVLQDVVQSLIDCIIH